MSYIDIKDRFSINKILNLNLINDKIIINLQHNIINNIKLFNKLKKLILNPIHNNIKELLITVNNEKVFYISNFTHKLKFYIFNLDTIIYLNFIKLSNFNINYIKIYKISNNCNTTENFNNFKNIISIINKNNNLLTINIENKIILSTNENYILKYNNLIIDKLNINKCITYNIYYNIIDYTLYILYIINNFKYFNNIMINTDQININLLFQILKYKHNLNSLFINTYTSITNTKDIYNIIINNKNLVDLSLYKLILQDINYLAQSLSLTKSITRLNLQYIKLIDCNIESLINSIKYNKIIEYLNSNKINHNLIINDDIKHNLINNNVIF